MVHESDQRDQMGHFPSRHLHSFTAADGVSRVWKPGSRFKEFPGFGEFVDLPFPVLHIKFPWVSRMVALCRQVKTYCKRFCVAFTSKRISFWSSQILAKDLLCVIKKCIQQRRQHNRTILMQYLQNPNALIEHDDYIDDGIDDARLSNSTNQGFLHTEMTLISRLKQ